LEREQCVDELKALLWGLGLKVFAKKELDVPNNIQELAQKRWEAKKQRQFAEADRLRQELSALGWAVLDGKEDYLLEKCK